jgi:hypothetical protein
MKSRTIACATRHPAEPRFRPVKPAGNGFPKKNSQTSRRNNSTQLGVGRIEEKAATASNKSPAVGIAAGSNGIKVRWEPEEKIVGPSIKHHPASVDSLHGRFLHFVPGPATRPTFALFQGSSVLLCRFHLGFTRRITRLYRRREIRKHHERRINFLDNFAVGFGGLLHRLPLAICAERFPVRGRRVAAGMR